MYIIKSLFYHKVKVWWIALVGVMLKLAFIEKNIWSYGAVYYSSLSKGQSTQIKQEVFMQWTWQKEEVYQDLEDANVWYLRILECIYFSSYCSKYQLYQANVFSICVAVCEGVSRQLFCWDDVLSSHTRRVRFSLNPSLSSRGSFSSFTFLMWVPGVIVWDSSVHVIAK